MSFPEHSPTTPGPSQHRHRASLGTRASGIADSTIADSTISFNTYATGITDGSLCLSQFPPPPVDLPITPISERFTPSPARSTFTISPPQFATPSPERGLPSPARSTFTITSRPSVSPVLPSPAQSTFTVVAPAPATLRGLRTSALNQPSGLNREVLDEDSPSIHNTGRPQHSDPRARSQSPTSPAGVGKLSPYDWHEGSSFISVDPNEERMLSTSFITGLLASNASPNPSAVSQVPRTPYQADTGSLVSEMFYPPPSRYREPGVESSRFPPGSYPFILPSEGSCFNGENDTIASHDGTSDVVHPGSTLTQKVVSVVGMAQATLRHMPSATSVPESIHQQSHYTYSSTSPLNPHPPLAFWTEEARPSNIQPADAQPLIGTFRPLTPGTPMTASTRPSAKRQRRVSTLSTRTVKSHVSSLISSAGQRTARTARAMMEWMQIKPLPPVPTIPDISSYQEQEHRRLERSVPLPHLGERADRLNVMLDSGHFPDHDIGSYSKPASEKVVPSRAYASGIGVPSGGRRHQSMTFPSQRALENPYGSAKANSKLFFKRPINRNKIKLFVGIFISVLLVLIGIIVGVTVGHKRTHSPSCPANRTGNTCNLDSTCVCVSSNTTQCNVLARSLVDLIPTVNYQFNTNFTPAVVANAMSSSQDSTLGNDCAAQAQVVDVSPALNPQTFPNRTTWAQSALLWSFVMSQNTSSVGSLRGFVTKADWGALPLDGPVGGQTSSFSTTQLGYVFDFAAQTISEPPVSFISDGQPSSSQLAEVGSTARTSLDRMYTFASASSTIRLTAMENYWQYTLQQNPNNYLNFVSLLISSSILLPFDANGTAGNISISSLLTNSSSAPFPPPLSCYPGLPRSQLALITDLETSVFGLSPPTTQTNFTNSCFADRPIYGVLDILHLRLPFPDSQTGTAKQAAILSRDASPRAVIYSGEVLSGLPNSNVSAIPTTDPRRFGTLNHINHVLLDFFEAISDVKVAIQFVKYVLSSAVTPPSSDTLLGQSLDSIPTLEVAIFGSVTPPDLEGVVSSLSTPSGALFFGSNDSLAVRDWAIVGAQKSVTWTESANSSKIVNDGSFTDNAFNAVWNPAFLFFHSSTNATVNVGNITAAFTAVDKFTST